MIFTSTRDDNLSVNFSQAVKECLPSDGGVFVPSSNSFEDLRRWIYYIDEKTTFTSIAGTLTSAFIQNEFSPIICERIATKAFPFSPVVKQLDDNLFLMELFHGFTGCHRDFGVSYLCSFLETTHELKGGKSVFVDFTHGELGALLAKVLRGKKHIKAVLVYKKGTVRGLTEEDYIWNGGNILPIEMEGAEVEIKRQIKQLMQDKAFVKDYNLTLANTTNVCRLMAQVFYFPYAFAQIKKKVGGSIFYAMEAGNYAALMAGLYSWRFAFPTSGIFIPSSAELSLNAVGNPVVLDSFVEVENRKNANPIVPANLERLEYFFKNNELMMRNFVFPCPVSEKNREKAAKKLFIEYGVFADSGTASAYASVLQNGQDVFDEDGAVVLVSQNHPGFSAEYCRHVVGEGPELPENIRETLRGVEVGREVLKTAEELKKIIVANINFSQS